MKLTKTQRTPEVVEAIKYARTLGAEAYQNGIRRAHDDAAVIELGAKFDMEQHIEIMRAWLQGATRAMFEAVEA